MITRGIKSLLPYLAGAAIALLAAFIIMPAPDLPEEYAVGTIVIPPELWQRQLEDVSTRSGIERATRKEAKPVVKAVAPGAAAEIVDLFVETAAITPDSMHTDVHGDTSVHAAAADTVCLGAGGSYRVRGTPLWRSAELVLLSACVPGKDGRTERYSGAQPDWSYSSGVARVSVSRIPPVVDWAMLGSFLALGYGLGARDPLYVAAGGAGVVLLELIF